MQWIPTWSKNFESKLWFLSFTQTRRRNLWKFPIEMTDRVESESNISILCKDNFRLTYKCLNQVPRTVGLCYADVASGDLFIKPMYNEFQLETEGQIVVLFKNSVSQKWDTVVAEFQIGKIQTEPDRELFWDSIAWYNLPHPSLEDESTGKLLVPFNKGTIEVDLFRSYYGSILCTEIRIPLPVDVIAALT